MKSGLMSKKCPLCLSPLEDNGDIKFIPKMKSIIYRGNHLRMGNVKFKMMDKFCSHIGETVSSETLWNILDNDGASEKKSLNHLAVHIVQLRKWIVKMKIPYRIISDYGYGYIMMPYEVDK